MNKYENAKTLMEGRIAYNYKKYGEWKCKVDFPKKGVK